LLLYPHLLPKNGAPTIFCVALEKRHGQWLQDKACT
jgi:hypothetical protein